MMCLHRLRLVSWIVVQRRWHAPLLLDLALQRYISMFCFFLKKLFKFFTYKYVYDKLKVVRSSKFAQAMAPSSNRARMSSGRGKHHRHTDTRAHRPRRCRLRIIDVCSGVVACPDVQSAAGRAGHAVDCHGLHCAECVGGRVAGQDGCSRLVAAVVV